jgi:hypothetical protein
MSSATIRRREKVKAFIKTLNVPKRKMWNRITDEKKPLVEFLQEKLEGDLLEEETSKYAKPYTGIVEDLEDCKNVECFVKHIDCSYTDSGELQYNGNYDLEKL